MNGRWTDELGKRLGRQLNTLDNRRIYFFGSRTKDNITGLKVHLVRHIFLLIFSFNMR